MIEWLSAWYNWPFLFSLFLGVGFAGIGMLGFAKAEVAHGGGSDFDHASHDADGSHDFDHDLGGWIGLGKAPLSVLLEAMLLTFGVLGLLGGAVGRAVLGDAGVAVFVASMVVGAIGALAAARGTAEVIARVAPSETPRKSGDLVGRVGKAHSRITASIGQALVERPGEPDALLNVRLEDPKAAEIPHGSPIRLVGYDAARALYCAAPDHESAEIESATRDSARRRERDTI